MFKYFITNFKYHSLLLTFVLPFSLSLLDSTMLKNNI